MVLHPDAAALVVHVAQKLALSGHAPVITHENGPRLMRLGEQMLDAFGIGSREEDAAAFVVDVALTAPRPEGRGFSHETQPAEDTADD
jgi:hypothetical protein